MARRFTDARAALADLLDRHEANPSATELFAYVDHEGFGSVTEYDRFAATAQEAARQGAVSLREGKGARRGQIVSLRLEDSGKLYRLIGRRPTGDRVAAAFKAAVSDLMLDPRLEIGLGEIRQAWMRGKSWVRLRLESPRELGFALRLAQGVLDGRHDGLDYRTFSRRATGDSKALERLEAVVVRLLGDAVEVPPEASPRDVLAGIGLEKFSPPLLFSGPIALGTFELAGSGLAYLGLPPTGFGMLRLRRMPDYVLTIENYASFHRHAAEVNASGGGLVLFTGGYPSRAIQGAITAILQQVHPKVPLFHWSDIDGGGLGIFQAVARCAGRPVCPHLMSVELAELLGRRPEKRPDLKPGGASNELIAPLWDYLAGPDAKTLEQEELDPVVPV